MNNVAAILETSIFDAYRDAIEAHIKESHYTDSLEKLIDFTRDCCPAKKRDAITLYSRYSRWRSAERQGINHDENINEIVQAILDISDEIATSARIGDQYALDSLTLESSSITRLSELDRETAPPGDRMPSTAKKPKLAAVMSQSEPSDDTTKGGTTETQDKPEELSPDAGPAVGVSEDGLRRNLAGRPLDYIRQAYLGIWRDTRAGGDDARVAKCQDVTKRFGGGRFSLSPISFDLNAGEITGIIGMNASGKTTLVRLLLGEIAPTSGVISYPSLSRTSNDWLTIRNQIAYVSQIPEKWNGRLRLNLNYTAAAYGSTGKENDELVDWYVHRYGLKEYEDATWDRISGGFKIRFELVRALLTKPKLLLLDEPLAYLDIVTQQIFLADIRSISSALANPIPIVFTSQHLYEIEAIANKMIILDNGNCLFSGPVGQMPHLTGFRTYEIAVRAEKKEVLELLRPVGLVDIEVTMTSLILTFDAEVDHSRVVNELIKGFGDRLTYFRDITRSTRSFFRNKRDDIAEDAAAGRSV